jgi:hypothetical protein
MGDPAIRYQPSEAFKIETKLQFCSLNTSSNELACNGLCLAFLYQGGEACQTHSDKLQLQLIDYFYIACKVPVGFNVAHYSSL